MNQDVLKITVKDLEKRRTELNDQQVKNEKAIKELQEMCEHDFEPENYLYEKCKYCGKDQIA